MKKLCLLLFVFALLVPTSYAATITVGPGRDYTTHTSAIAAATAGDTIESYSGTYNETVTLNKQLTWSIPNGQQVVISRSTAGIRLVRISASNCTIDASNAGAGYLHIVDPYDTVGDPDYEVFGIEIDSGVSNTVIKGARLTKWSTGSRTIRILGTDDYKTAGPAYIFRGIRNQGTSTEIDSVEIVNCARNAISNTNLCRYAYIHDCYLHGTLYHMIAISGRDGTENTYYYGHRIYDNVLIDAEEDGIQSNSSALDTVTDATSVHIKGNLIYDTRENAIDGKGAQYWIIEQNYMSHAIGDEFYNYPTEDFSGGVSITCGSGQRGNNLIIRNNVIIDSGSGGFSGGIKYSTLYHNTSINNNTDYRGSNQTSPLITGAFYALHMGWTDCHAKNNIGVNAYYMSWAQTSSYSVPGQYSSDYNIYYNPNYRSGAYYFWDNGAQVTQAQWLSLGFDANSLFADPMLSLANYQPTGNPSSLDFSLQAGSPAIDAGTWLATIASVAGNVLTLSTDGAKFFHDGFGVVGLSGDTIYDDDGETAVITAVDYSANTITLDDATGFTAGDGLTTINYNGTTPDIGALEYGTGGSTPTGEPAQTTNAGRITTGHGRIGAGYGRMQ